MAVHKNRVLAAVLCIVVVGVTYSAIVNNSEMTPSNSFLPRAFQKAFTDFLSLRGDMQEIPDSNVTSVDELEMSLAKAANPNKTVIITTLNRAWAEPNSMLDLFLESFRNGEGTEGLLKNLLIVAVDKKASTRCQKIHPHCYLMKTQGVDFSAEKIFMSEDYLKMMWRRLRFFGEVLERGYTFVFSDADIMWFRDPFKRFSPNADIQIASDRFNGKPKDMHNDPNGGFMYVRSNERTISFFRHWYDSRRTYPGKNEQDVLNILKFTPDFARRGLEFRFLDTKYFRGFCQGNSDLSSVYTMHANCCKGLSAKLFDLRNALSDWSEYRISRNQSMASTSHRVHWTTPRACRESWKKRSGKKRSCRWFSCIHL